MVPEGVGPGGRCDAAIEKKEDGMGERAEEAFAVSEVVEEESRERGRVKSAVYKQYVKAVGTSLSASIAVSMTLMQVSKNMTDVWLAEWVTAEKGDNKTDSDVVDFYLPVYGGIAGANSLFSLARAFLFAYGGICAARNVHKRLFGVVMEAKTSFFDTTPVGRILNRFSSDLYTVDDSLPFILNIFLARLFAVVGVLVICVYSVPWIVLLLVPLGFVYHGVQGRGLLGFL